MTELTDTPTTRPAFLKRLAVTLGAAVGVAAALPAVAHASLNCCRSRDLPNDPCQGSPSCGSMQTQFLCDCPEEDYCICGPEGTPCYNGPC
jgi:hypothetical protein